MKSVSDSYATVDYTCIEDINKLRDLCVKSKYKNAVNFIDTCIKKQEKILPRIRQKSLSNSRLKSRGIRNRFHTYYKEMAVCLNILYLVVTGKTNDVYFGFVANLDDHYKVINQLFKHLKYCYVNRLRSELGIIQFYIRNIFFGNYVIENQKFENRFDIRLKKFKRQRKAFLSNKDMQLLKSSYDAYTSYIHTHHLEYEFKTHVGVKDYKLICTDDFKLYHLASIVSNYLKGIRKHILPEEVNTFNKLMTRRRRQLLSLNAKTPIGSLVKLKEMYFDHYFDEEDNVNTCIGITVSNIHGDDSYINSGMVVEVLHEGKVDYFRIAHLEVINEKNN
tara:strand:+ start:49 stop:1050 length:1002 start_codon:yes stop_codon:yes gene_type:complete